MTIVYQYEEWTEGKGSKKVERSMRVLEEPIAFATPFLHLYRSADGGIELDHKDWDEFDNLHRVKISLDANDIVAIKDMINRNLL